MNDETLNIIKKVSNGTFNDLDNYINNKKDEYFYKGEIFSEKIRGEIFSNDDNLEQLAILNWFIKDRASKDFSEEQIEYMTESLYSQFKYLEKKIGMSFNEYLEREGDNLKNIIIDKNIGEEVLGTYSETNKVIRLSKDVIEASLEDGDYRKFYNAFSHENNHSISLKKDSYGFFVKTPLFAITKVLQGKASNMNEFATENLALEMTREYFPDFIERNIQKEDKHSFIFLPSGTVSYESRGYSYTNIIDASLLVYKCYENKILDCFLHDRKMKNVFDKDTLVTFNEMGKILSKTFPKDTYDYNFNSGENQLRFENICATLVSYYINEQLDKKASLSPINDKSKVEEIDNNINEILQTIVNSKRTLKTETSNYNIEQIYLKKIENNCPKLKVDSSMKKSAKDRVRDIKIPKTKESASKLEKRVDKILEKEEILVEETIELLLVNI